MTPNVTAEAQPQGNSGATEAPRSLSAFISYASPDKIKAFDIAGTLEARGLTCWIAPRDVRPAKDYAEEVIAGIREARCLVLVLSDAANQSPWVRREVERAISHNKPVFSVRIEEVLPARSLEFFVSATQWIDAFQGSLQEHCERLAAEIADEKRLTEVRGEIQRRVRRRQLPRWIGGFVLLVGGIVLGTVLTNRQAPDSNPNAQPTGAWLFQSIKDAGLDPGTLTRNSFHIEVKSETVMGMPGKLIITSPGALDGVIGRGALEYRVGSRPWKTASYDPFASQVSGLLDAKDVDAHGPVQIRFNAQPPYGPGPLIGPFDYDIDIAVVLGTSQRATALTRTDWLSHVGGAWFVDVKFLQDVVDVVKTIRIGDTPTHWVIERQMPTRPGPGASTKDAAGFDMRVATAINVVDLMPFAGRDLLYAQIELRDGTVGPILKIGLGSGSGK